MSLCFTSANLKLQVTWVLGADLVDDVDSRKSTTRFVYTLGSTAVCWTLKL
jgi:hypothetical protein